jgi:peptidoglycan/LPS O-acetylase OafA/YrhL
LLEEKRKKGINIKNFYTRRILRIWPLYYLYLIISILTWIIFGLPFSKRTLLFYVFFSANIPFIFGGDLFYIGHYWSLGVEEQFYLFCPWIIKKSKSILKVITIICIALVLLKCVFWYAGGGSNHSNENWPYLILHITRFQCILIGAIGAILYFQKNSLFLKITTKTIFQFLSWLIILLIALNKFHIIEFLDHEFISVVTIFLIIGQIEKTRKIVNLDISFFDFIGKISYGIYVIHPLIIFYLSKVMTFTDKTNVSSYLIVYFSVFMTTILLAYLSYEFFEKRFLFLKEKYSTVRNSGDNAPLTTTT